MYQHSRRISEEESSVIKKQQDIHTVEAHKIGTIKAEISKHQRVLWKVKWKETLSRKIKLFNVLTGPIPYNWLKTIPLVENGFYLDKSVFLWQHSCTCTSTEILKENICTISRFVYLRNVARMQQILIETGRELPVHKTDIKKCTVTVRLRAKYHLNFCIGRSRAKNIKELIENNNDSVSNDIEYTYVLGITETTKSLTLLSLCNVFR